MLCIPEENILFCFNNTNRFFKTFIRVDLHDLIIVQQADSSIIVCALVVKKMAALTRIMPPLSRNTEIFTFFKLTVL